MTDAEKLTICRKCANTLISKKFCPLIDVDELVNVGFINITIADPREAVYYQAYLRMLTYIIKNTYAKADSRDPRPHTQPPVDELVDLRHALGMLSSDERQLIDERFFQDMSIKEVAKAQGHSGPWVSIRIREVLKKLERILR